MLERPFTLNRKRYWQAGIGAAAAIAVALCAWWDVSGGTPRAENMGTTVAVTTATTPGHLVPTNEPAWLP
ncbi:hypothetical protein SD51_04730, partial [Alicyclobacillus tengchongensis]